MKTSVLESQICSDSSSTHPYERSGANIQLQQWERVDPSRTPYGAWFPIAVIKGDWEMLAGWGKNQTVRVRTHARRHTHVPWVLHERWIHGVRSAYLSPQRALYQGTWPLWQMCCSWVSHRLMSASHMQTLMSVLHSSIPHTHPHTSTNAPLNWITQEQTSSQHLTLRQNSSFIFKRY